MVDGVVIVKESFRLFRSLHDAVVIDMVHLEEYTTARITVESRSSKSNL
jgi:hypothetical protein